MMILGPRARRDLDEAYGWIARDNPRAPARTIERLFDVMDRLESRELIGLRVRITDDQLVRRWSVPLYRIYYRERGDQIEVVRVYRQARRPIER